MTNTIDVKVTSEPLTYERHSPTSYFKDRIMLVTNGDEGARNRLERHASEMEVVRADREKAAWRSAGSLNYEYRVNPNPIQGQGGYGDPPLWLIDQFKTAARPGRVLANLLPHFDLPQGVSSINLPKWTTGNADTSQSPPAGVPDTDVVDAAATSTVVTITGEADVALQLLEQSPAGAHLDWAMFKDMAEAYDASLETQLLNGVTSQGQLAGVIGLATGNNAVAYTSGSPTFAATSGAALGLYYYMGQAAGQVGENRKLPPEFWLMRTGRWSWIASSYDGQYRPVTPPDTRPPAVQPGTTAATSDSPNAVTYISGWPVYLTDAIPNTLGTGGNQDTVIVMRGSGIPLFEGAPTMNVFLEVLSGTLGARIQMHNYAAAVTTAYTSAVATVSGSGLVYPSGF